MGSGDARAGEASMLGVGSGTMGWVVVVVVSGVRGDPTGDGGTTGGNCEACTAPSRTRPEESGGLESVGLGEGPTAGDIVGTGLGDGVGSIGDVGEG
jgi:hypothetical protein